MTWGDWAWSSLNIKKMTRTSPYEEKPWSHLVVEAVVEYGGNRRSRPKRWYLLVSTMDTSLKVVGPKRSVPSLKKIREVLESCQHDSELNQLALDFWKKLYSRRVVFYKITSEGTLNPWYTGSDFMYSHYDEVREWANRYGFVSFSFYNGKLSIREHLYQGSAYSVHTSPAISDKWWKALTDTQKVDLVHSLTSESKESK